MSYLALLAGFVLLIGGGEAMLRGAVGVARRFGLSEIFVGIAIVGFATSAPELFVSVDAALAGRPAIAVGNVVGSNTANLLLILGAGAAIRAIYCPIESIRRDALMLIFGVVVLGAIVLNGGADRAAGAAMLAALAAYLAFAFVKDRRKQQLRLDDILQTEDDAGPQSVYLLGGLVVLGIAALAAGAELLIFGAVQIAETAGLSERVISISLVAIGTSLPELATGLVAAMRRQSDVAIGNVLGSCVFNVFAILGVTALAAPIEISPAEFGVDAAVSAFASAAIIGLAIFASRISRLAGVGLLVIYFAYMAALFLTPAA